MITIVMVARIRYSDLPRLVGQRHVAIGGTEQHRVDDGVQRAA